MTSNPVGQHLSTTLLPKTARRLPTVVARRLRTRWRRWRLLRAYSRVFTAKTGKRVGVTPVMAAYERAERDGVLSLQEDGDVEWHWPTGEQREAP